MSLVFIRDGEKMSHLMVYSGDVLSLEHLKTLDTNPPLADDLMKLKKDELKGLLSSLNMRLANFAKAKKQEVVEKIVSQWNVIASKASNKEASMPSSSQDHAYPCAPVSSDALVQTEAENMKSNDAPIEDEPSNGYGFLKDKVASVKGYRISFIQGLLHVNTKYGSFQVASDTKEALRWIATHNCFISGRDDSKEDGNASDLSSHESDTDAEKSAEEVPIETPPFSESEDEADDVKDEMKVMVCNYQTKDKMFSGKVSISQDVKWLKNYMLEWQDVSKEDKMGLNLCDKNGVCLSEEMSICDAMKAMKSRTFYLRNKGLCGGASRITKVKRQEKSKTLQNKVKDLVAEVASMRRDTSMQEVEAVIAQFMERSNTAPIDTIKDFLAKSEIVLLQKMDAEIKKSNSGKAEDKFKSVAPFFFGEKMQVLNDRKIAIEKIIATAKASMDFAWSKACEQDEKFSMPVFLSLIDKCISFKQGQASSTAPAPVPMQT